MIVNEGKMAAQRINGFRDAVKIVLQGYPNKFAEIILPYVLSEQFSTTLFIFNMADYQEMKRFYGQSLTDSNAMQILEDATECTFNEQTISYLHVSLLKNFN